MISFTQFLERHVMESWKVTSANDNPKKSTTAKDSQGKTFKGFNAPASYLRPKLQSADQKHYVRNFRDVMWNNTAGKRTNDNHTWDTYHAGVKMSQIFKVPTSPPLETIKRSLELSDRMKRKSKIKSIKKDDD